jgi:transcriptional regulator with XRE-family HTH domain
MPDRLWTQPLNASDLGQFLAELRRERGWTQDELAELLHTNRRYVYEIEHGKSNLYSDRLFALLRLLQARLVVEAQSGERELPSLRNRQVQ